MFIDNVVTYTYENKDGLTGEFVFKIKATDVNGRTSGKECIFVYDNDAIKMASPAGVEEPPGPLVTYADTIRFDVKPVVDRVYYRVDGGEEINATFKEGFYDSYPKYVGWLKNKNVTVKVYADVIYYFENIDRCFNNTLIDSSEYYLRVGSEGIGIEPSPRVKLPEYTPPMVPGFEIIVVIIALFLIVLMFKKNEYKKK
jgi:hypothetical protein